MQFTPEGASHYPILIKALSLSEGPALEMGSGPFSTPLMHWLCLEGNRKLISYENNHRWFDKLKRFETALHNTIHIKDWDEVDISKTHWGVAFIDHAPNERRKIDIKKLANCADYIVIHDSGDYQDEHYLYSEIYPLFKYKYDYTREKPFTTVLSNVKDLKEFEEFN